MYYYKLVRNKLIHVQVPRWHNNTTCACNSQAYLYLDQVIQQYAWIGSTFMSKLYSIINSLCEEHDISGYKLCNDVGISKSTLTDLKMGRKKTLNAITAAKIADYFGVSVSYLLGESNQKNKTSAEAKVLSEEAMKLLKQIEKLTPANRAKLEELCHLYLADQDKK